MSINAFLTWNSWPFSESEGFSAMAARLLSPWKPSARTRLCHQHLSKECLSDSTIVLQKRDSFQKFGVVSKHPGLCSRKTTGISCKEVCRLGEEIQACTM